MYISHSSRKQVATKPSKKKISAPSAPTGEPIGTQIGANTLTLRWGKPTDDGGAKVDEYKIEQRRYLHAVILHVFIQCNSFAHLTHSITWRNQ